MSKGEVRNGAVAPIQINENIEIVFELVLDIHKLNSDENHRNYNGTVDSMQHDSCYMNIDVDEISSIKSAFTNNEFKYDIALCGIKIAAKYEKFMICLVYTKYKLLL